MKFKKGNVVKIIAKNHGHQFKIGSKVKIKEVRKNNDYEASYLNGRSAWFIGEDEVEADGILHDISKLNDKFSKLDMAEQQFLGFHYGKWNHSDVTGLIIAMGLTINEWKILKSDYELSYLDDDTLDDIENFFINANENSQKTNIPD